MSNDSTSSLLSSNHFEKNTPPEPPPPGERLYSLDALRAAALLTGVVFHSVLAYVMPPGQWAVGVSAPVMPLWWFVHYTHNFRMEIFFLLAGFFACLVIDKKGVNYFLHDRWIRIVLVFLVLLYPIKLLITMPWIQGGLKSGWLNLPPEVASLPLPDLAMGAILEESFPNINLTHLWFLYYLVLVTFSFVGIRWLVMKIPNRRATSNQAAVEKGFFRLFSSWLAPLMLTLVMVPVFAKTPRYLIDSPEYSLAIDYPALVIYGLFFTIGWWLRRRSDLLKVFSRRWKILIPLSIIATTFALYLDIQRITVGDSNSIKWMASFSNAFTMCLAVFGWTGLFVAVFNRPSVKMRYVADSSYWVYLAHLPVVLILQVMVYNWNSLLLKLVVVIGGTFAFTMLSYHWGVRFTVIGKWLNGRQYVRPISQPNNQPLETET